MNSGLQNQIDTLIANLTLEEKAAFCSGKDLWHLKNLDTYGIPAIMVSDGPHGLRKTGSGDNMGLGSRVAAATCFPTSTGLAATWDRQLLYEIGCALGEECLQEGVAVLLGPGANIKRSPLCGRNFEYYSEDPYLTGECAAALISGVQSKGIGTSLKHFAVNNQERYRMTINALVDERALREIYLTGFEKAVRQAKPWTIMAAYNKVNGTYATENSYLLDQILRKEWGFDGVVMSDWGATNDRVLALQAGMDLEMPASGGRNDRLLVEAVVSGRLAEADLDAAVRRLLTLILTAQENAKSGFTYNQDVHHQLARTAAAHSMVLLKNNHHLLPLQPTATVALIGDFAKNPRYQGAGSSYVTPRLLENAYDAALLRLGERLLYARGYDSAADRLDEKLLQEAIDVAKKADIAVIMAGLTEEYESEGFDRAHLRLPSGHNRLIEEICRVHANVVVVLHNGAPVLMPWLDDVAAVLEAYLPGEAGGPALWDVLLGDVNPCGRLAESFPAAESDYASASCFPMGPDAVEYRESLFVGYRFYDAAAAEPLFPFGFGLSYTTFSYRDLTVSKSIFQANEPVTVTVTVENTGERAGAEVVQLYIGALNHTILRPQKELKDYAKVSLQPTECQTVTFTLPPRAFAYYNTQLKAWCVDSGTYQVMVGSSSRHIHCQQAIMITAETKHSAAQQSLPSAAMPDVPAAYRAFHSNWHATQEDFARLYGAEIPQEQKQGRIDRNTPLEMIRSNLIGRLIYSKMMKQLRRQAGDSRQHARMMEAVVKEMPLRGIAGLSQGRLRDEQVDILIDLMNGKIISGIKKITNGRRP